MSYSLSFDAHGKIPVNSTADRTRIEAHVFRDAVESTFHKSLNHSNENISHDMTSANMSFRFDSTRNDLVSTTDFNKIRESIDERIAYGVEHTKRLRKDAVAIRLITMQIDPTYFSDEVDETVRKQKILMSSINMMKWAQKTFGRANLVGASIHVDESHPHVHMMIVPVDPVDGALRQKTFFKDPASLKDMHKSARAFMRERGYDVSLSNVGKTTQKLAHLNDDEMRDIEDVKRYVAKTKALRSIVKTKQSQLEQSIDDLMAREARVNTRADRIATQEDSLKEREQALQAKEKALAEASAALESQKRALERREEEARETLREARETRYKARLKAVEAMKSENVDTPNSPETSINLHLPRW